MLFLENTRPTIIPQGSMEFNRPLLSSFHQTCQLQCSIRRTASACGPHPVHENITSPERQLAMQERAKYIYKRADTYQPRDCKAWSTNTYSPITLTLSIVIPQANPTLDLQRYYTPTQLAPMCNLLTSCSKALKSIIEIDLK
uniref:Uncharacterized protein n=1 Tax=Mucochytrium quahogii TaxID=96639 RepID=A0A7S2RHE2_9STRA